MTDISRMPLIAIFNVRGMGVADKVSISTPANMCLNFSLCATPNRCSSSTIASPSERNSTSFCTMRWVPMMTSALPLLISFRISFCRF